MVSGYANTLFSMAGKVVVVVGGLGQIGINTVRIVLDAGARVAVIDVLDDQDYSLSEPLATYRDQKELAFFKADITKEAAVLGAAKSVVELFGCVDVLVNHAHYKGDPRLLKPHSPFFAPIEDYPFEIWKQTIDVNLNGLFLVSKAFGKLMVEQKRGVIINTSSTYGIVSARKNIYGDSGINSPVSYATTKAAILNFSRYLATHWAEHNIRVNTISPGGVGNRNQSNEFVQNYSNMTPLNRMALPTEYQGAVLFLASDASSYMTGANLVVDGGWTAW